MYEIASNPAPDPVWSGNYVSDMGIPLYYPLQTAQSATEYGGAKLGCVDCGGRCGMKGLGFSASDDEDSSWFSAHGIADALVYAIAGFSVFAVATTLIKGPAAAERRQKIRKAKRDLAAAKKLSRF